MAFAELLLAVNRNSGTKGLTYASTNAGVNDFGTGVGGVMEAQIMENGIFADLAIVKSRPQLPMLSRKRSKRSNRT